MTGRNVEESSETATIRAGGGGMRPAWPGADLAARWALALAAGALAATLWTAFAGARSGTGGADELRSSRIVLVDGEGRTRGVLSVEENGPALELVDPSGDHRARLELGIGGPELRMDGPGGQLRLGLGDVVRDGAGLSLYDASDRLRLGLAYSGGSGTNLVLADGAGRVRVGLTVDSAGPYAVLLGPDGEPVWERP